MAEIYNTDVSVLKGLNYQQIENIDLIFDGNTIKIPKRIDASTKEREEVAELNNDKLIASVCEKPKYSDSLFIPQHPETGKMMYILLTCEGKEAILEDSKKCFSSIQGTREEILKGLAKLGVLDPFLSLSHEAFLKKGDVFNLRDAISTKMSLVKNVSESKFWFPQHDNQSIGLVDITEKIEKIENRYKNRVSYLNRKYKNKSNITYGDYWKLSPSGLHHQLDIALKNRNKRLVDLQNDLIEELDKAISNLKELAVRNARKTKIEESNSVYAFSDRGYFTTDRQSESDKALVKLVELRKSEGISDHLSSENLKLNSKITCIKEVVKFYDYWKEKSHPIIMNAKGNISISYLLSIKKAGKYRHVLEKIHRLNQAGYKVKEQCLNRDELLGGHDIVEDFRDFIEENKYSIIDIQKKLSNINFYELGYYPSYIINLLILKEVATRIDDFTKLVDGNEDYANYVRILIEFSELASKRSEDLKRKAEEEIYNHYLFYSPPVSYGSSDVPQSDNIEIIWDEREWRPEDLTNNIFSSSGVNKLSIVECALSSEPDNIIYIRSNNPVINTDISVNKKYGEIYTFNPDSVVTGDGQISRIPSDLINKIRSNQELKLHEWKGLENDQYIGPKNLSENIVFQWGKKDAKVFGARTRVETNGEAQFLRFISEGTIGVTNEMITDGAVKAKVEFKTGLKVASASSSIKISFPEKKEGWKLLIPYKTKNYLAGKGYEVERHEKDLGAIQLVVSGTVRGEIAISLHLASEFHVGNACDSGIGVKGMIDLSSTTQNELREYQRTAARQTGQQANGGTRKITAGSTNEAKAFAGLEVGGSITANLQWKKSNTGKYLDLVKTGSGIRGTAGIGGSATLMLAFRNGKFIFIFGLSGSFGLGVGGKLSAEINLFVIEDFISELLEIMQKRNFSRFEFFDEDENSDGLNAFGALNTYLTVAAAFGLTITQVMLLPISIIKSMEKKATSRENAHLVANFILSENNKTKNSAWIINMPSETLAKLLNVLITYTPIPDIAILDYQKENRDEIARRNQSQRKGIIRILEWLGGKEPDLQQIRRFENSVQRMGLSEPTKLNDAEKWQRYAINVIKLRNFFKAAQNDYYEYPNEKENNKYMNIVDQELEYSFVMLSRLTSINIVMGKSRYNGRGGPSVEKEYVSVNISDVSRFRALGYQNVKWL
ncbi:conserved hypothetical protein [Vibrio nigripulchritudo SOn1]|uniref:Uncharacterized protein n=1 Tax=Vibrio nigripulchritudo SOn1 TaxID=1238450 RepID=A0AAV2VMQ4_9VIBR|nr:conserved hypothetical protein [Vibrio nigripulchritudo SOn1]